MFKLLQWMKIKTANTINTTQLILVETHPPPPLPSFIYTPTHLTTRLSTQITPKPRFFLLSLYSLHFLHPPPLLQELVMVPFPISIPPHLFGMLLAFSSFISHSTTKYVTLAACGEWWSFLASRKIWKPGKSIFSRSESLEKLGIFITDWTL